MELLEMSRASFKDSKDIAPRFNPPLMSIARGAFKDSAFKNILGAYTKAYCQFDFRFWDQSNAEYFLSAHLMGGFNGDFAPVRSTGTRPTILDQTSFHSSPWVNAPSTLQTKQMRT